MQTTTVWYSGKDNYKKNIFIEESQLFKPHRYNLELLDQEFPANRTLDEIFLDHVSDRQTKYVEVLYSGGLDSECVLNSCLNNKIPVRAMTMRLLTRGIPINTHDLYYSERFCRSRNIEQVLVDLNLDSFFGNSDYLELLQPYKITYIHVATHFWLFKQCDGFPVMGGDYSWPQLDRKIISPHRQAFAMYDRFLSDNGIHGIGNMLSHSAESNLFFLKHHVDLVNNDTDNIYGGDDFKITFLKRDLLRRIGFTDVEHRMKSYGWDNLNPLVFNGQPYLQELRKTLGTTISSVTYGQQIADAVGGVPGTQTSYGK